jgi:hypothetical protein
MKFCLVGALKRLEKLEATATYGAISTLPELMTVTNPARSKPSSVNDMVDYFYHA